MIKTDIGYACQLHFGKSDQGLHLYYRVRTGSSWSGIAWTKVSTAAYLNQYADLSSLASALGGQTLLYDASITNGNTYDLGTYFNGLIFVNNYGTGFGGVYSAGSGNVTPINATDSYVKVSFSVEGGHLKMTASSTQGSHVVVTAIKIIG